MEDGNRSVSIDGTISTSCMRYAFESNGELMLVLYSGTFEYGVNRFDWSRKCWFSLYNLGDRTLFVSLKTFCVKTIEEEELNNLASLNEIHVLDNSCYRKEGELFDAFMIWKHESTFRFNPPDSFATRKH